MIVEEGCFRFPEGDAMLAQIRRRLARIPFEPESVHD
jgi:hypothetical protein